MADAYRSLYNESVKAISYSALRANLAKSMDQVWDDREPMIVTRQGGRPVVILSLEDYESLDETAYLMRNPHNAERLRESLQQAEEGKTVSKTMEELEELAR